MKLSFGRRQNGTFGRRWTCRGLGGVGLAMVCGFSGPAAAQTPAPVEFGFLWHMHQPIYTPGQNVLQTNNSGRFSFSLVDVHTSRTGPYTTWPRDAVQSGLGQPNLGAQVSFSGSLIENLNTLENAGIGFNNWEGAYQQARGWNTAEGNPRLDLVNFNYHHALSPLLDTRDLRMQIKLHKHIVDQQFGGAPADQSRGYFPAETAFSARMIPALKAEGIDWTLFDSIHLERAVANYPHTNGSNLFAPNRADQINPAIPEDQWVQLNNLWAPSQVAAPFAYRPHMAQYVDPNTGEIEKIIAVPAARYEGNEDGRGGFGALQYESVFSQYRHLNTDPDHPMFVVLHHDGDNFGGGSDAYYHGNFNNLVNWVSNTPDYNATTVQDYLDRFPVDPNDVVHIEPGSWAGADNGDPEFKRWLGDPDPNTGWSPDRNSWAVLTAAKNHVFTADDLQGVNDLQNVIDNTGNGTERAWHYLLQAEASDHWYWDGTETWDSNVTIGSNLAVTQANTVIGSGAGETTGPTVFHPQRESYNPGGFEWDLDNPEPSDFEVWTYAYDLSGLESVTLKYRLDEDGFNPLDSIQNETYAGGVEVGDWISLVMSASDLNPPGNIESPIVRAERFGAMITGLDDVLVDYYVEAVDLLGNVTRSDIQHVYVGDAVSPPTSGGGFVMDGSVDDAALLVASTAGQHLYVDVQDGQLYVATEDGGEGNDVFIFIAEQPGGAGAAQWGKAGQVAGWDAFLANENDNGWSGWFDATQGQTLDGLTATGNGSGYLEGVLDLAALFGENVPDEIYLAVGLFETGDGGALVAGSSVLEGNDGDGNIDGVEYILLDLTQFLAATQIEGDHNGDGFVSQADLNLVLLNWGLDEVPDGWLDAAGFDGAISQNELNEVLLNWGDGEAPDFNAIPEPTSAALLGLLGGAVFTRRTARTR
ncbi:MAG: PEP-CTERM sorting domain-containing protein [Planctomycetota bacterium]